MKKISSIVEGLLEFINNTYPHIVSEIETKLELAEQIETEMKTANELYMRDRGQEFSEGEDLVN